MRKTGFIFIAILICAVCGYSFPVIASGRVPQNPSRLASKIEVPSDNAQLRKEEWYAFGNKLLHTFAEPSPHEEFDASELALRVLPDFSSIAFLDGALYCSSGGEILCLVKGANKWKKIDLDLPKSEYELPCDLIADGDSLLISMEELTLRYYPKPDRFRVESIRIPELYRLLGTDGKTLWFSASDRVSPKKELLYKNNRETGLPEPINLPESPAKSRVEGDSELRAFAFCGGFAWCETRSYKLKRRTIIGFDVRKRQWTSGFSLPGDRLPPVNARSWNGSVYMSSASPNATILGYDPILRKWSASEAVSKGSTPARKSFLLSLDDKEAWGYFDRDSIQCYDRKKKTWKRFRAHAALLEEEFKSCTTGAENEFLINAPDSVCSFNRKTKAWMQLPLPPLFAKSASLSECGISSKYVWLDASSQKNRYSVIVRFNKKEKTWTTWQDEDIFKDLIRRRFSFMENENLWILNHANLMMRFDNKTDQWVHVSNELGSKRKPLQIRTASLRSESVWMQPGKDHTDSNELDSETDSPLIRYDLKTGEYHRLNPLPGRAIAYREMRIIGNEISLPTKETEFRYDMKTGKWRESPQKGN